MKFNAKGLKSKVLAELGNVKVPEKAMPGYAETLKAAQAFVTSEINLAKGEAVAVTASFDSQIGDNRRFNCSVQTLF